MSKWINFKELREQLRFADVLRYFKIEVKAKGAQHLDFCPLPQHEGERRSPSFSANLEKGIFQCFGCGAKGNVLEFAALMKGVSPADGKAMLRVALQLRDAFQIGSAAAPKQADGPKQQDREGPSTGTTPKLVAINAPLDFELKGLDPQHPYIAERGISQETALYFGLGVGSRGLLEGRLAIPIHDPEHRLVGYAGRLVDETKISKDNPRYRLPGKRERNRVIHEFRKSLLLYNGSRLKGPLDELIVVEGFVSVWWLHQCGITNVVATLGCDCSERQAQLIAQLVATNGRVWLMPDADEPGIRGAATMLARIAPLRFCRWVRLPEGQQPTDLPADEVTKYLR